MFGRGWIVFFLAGAAFLPYFLSSKSDLRDTLTSPLHAVSKETTTDKPAMPGASADSRFAAPTTSRSIAATPVSASAADKKLSTNLTPLETALQWNVKPAWVLATWPRVTTALSDLDLQGYRLSYVSGTTESDLAGSLTYYFDEQLQARRITFNGTTGDARRLVQFLMSQHKFERRLHADPSTYLYQVEQDGAAISELRVTAASVVRAGSPLTRFEVTLTMNFPE